MLALSVSLLVRFEQMVNYSLGMYLFSQNVLELSS